MSSPGSPSLVIERSARSEFTVVGLVLAILAVVPWWLPYLSVAMATLLTLTVCGLACLSFWHIGWLGGRRALRKVLWTGEGEWRVFDQAGASWEATLHPGSQIMGKLLWLRFASSRGPRQLLLVGADLAPDQRRRLITRLRLQGAGQAKAPRGAVPSDLP